MEDNKKPISEQDLEVLSIDTPEEYTPVPTEPQQPKKTRKGIIALVIGLVILGIAGAVAAYLLFFQPDAADTQTNGTDAPETS